MSQSISIHDCQYLSDCVKSELISLFYKIDKDATGDAYNNSTVDMSKEMFNIPSDVSDKKSLEIFLEKLGEIIVFAIDDYSEDIIGFTLLNPHDKLFNKFIPEYQPLLAVTYSGIHPDYQGEGIWKNLRKYVHNKIIPEYPNIDYLVTSAPKENTISIKANLSMGMKKVKSTNEVSSDEETILFVKPI